ncbi:MAG: peptide chain release factor 2 [Chloroflexi bacterium]|nr:peptide chain release factor 2 [Chloroflexota bacterium]
MLNCRKCVRRSTACWSVFDLPAKEAEVAKLHERSAEAGFWDDPEAAQAVMQQIADLEEEICSWRQLEAKIAEITELWDMAEAEEDSALMEEMAAEVEALEKQLVRMRLDLLLSGPHDAKDAILSIYAGAGGTESQDWVEMLLRMYLRWAERRGYEAEIIDQTEGDEAGLKSVTLEIRGHNAFGYLRSERGVHRLVRISPFDNAHRRHTSFALVEVIPDVAKEIDIQIDPDDVRMDVFRASGHGGQNVQKNSTAVRLTHIPTGIVVQCQNERSQVQNRERAMEVLKARLYDLEVQKQEEEQARLRGEHVSAGWGNQIRSYVLHPYRMVKDLRTGWETGNTTAVLDGDIDGLIEAYLRYKVGDTIQQVTSQ